jgi:hypothetical protein
VKRGHLLSVRLRGSLPPTGIPLSETELLAITKSAHGAGLTPGALVRSYLHLAADSHDYRALVQAAAECCLSLPEWARVVVLASIEATPLCRQLVRTCAPWARLCLS